MGVGAPRREDVVGGQAKDSRGHVTLLSSGTGGSRWLPMMVPARSRDRNRIRGCLTDQVLLRAAQDARWRRCRRSKDAQSAFAPAPCHRTPWTTLATDSIHQTPPGPSREMTTADAVRRVGLALPRTYERQVRGLWKLKVKQIVYVAFSRDELSMGFGFPKAERDGLVAS